MAGAYAILLLNGREKGMKEVGIYAGEPMDQDNIEIIPVLVEDLRKDSSGSLISQIGNLAYLAFREPPWSDDHEKPRLHFGLGVDLMRRNALAFAAINSSGRIVGYDLGYEVFRESKEPRDLTLYDISVTNALDHLFEGGQRVFYEDTICVDPEYRRRHISYRLSFAQIEAIRAGGFSYRIGRTAMTCEAMKTLYTKLGHQELNVHDVVYPERTYWLLKF
jgi:GNAT superfamily N-acetyltransferase